MAGKPVQRLSAETFAAFGAAGVDNTTATYCCHAATKAMTAFAHNVAWLISTFHGEKSRISIG